MLDGIRLAMNLTETENGAEAFRSTGGACVDFFAAAGALRMDGSGRAIKLFARAYAENSLYALRTLFYARDIRGGLGERRLFRELLGFAAHRYPESLSANIAHIPFYGRYDDCLALLGTPCEAALTAMIAEQLDRDTAAMEAGENVSLLAKWLPSVNASSPETREKAEKLCRLLHMSRKDYRRRLSALRGYIDILERRLTERDYTFDYGKQPSGALWKHRKAFIRNDGQRYGEFIENVLSGKAKLNAGTLFPYELIRECRSDCYGTQRKVLDAAWNSLPDYTKGGNAIAVVDGSGSMYWDSDPYAPIDVAVSLGIYFAERSKGLFRNSFITFSENPRLIDIEGSDIYEKAAYCMSYNECANTNLERVFLLILAAAENSHAPQCELPETVYIISDMEFDYGCVRKSGTIFRSMKALYEERGYKLPAVVYWNVCSRNEQYPVERNESGAVLVSGCSPTVFSYAMAPDMTPEGYMRSVLDSERYSRITA